MPVFYQPARLSSDIVSRTGAVRWLATTLMPSLAFAPSMKRLRQGLSTVIAAIAEAIVMTEAAMNTRSQLPLADNTDASGTSSEAVPLAVYKVPALPAAYLTPNVSAQIAGKIEKISPQNRNTKAAN